MLRGGGGGGGLVCSTILGYLWLECEGGAVHNWAACGLSVSDTFSKLRVIILFNATKAICLSPLLGCKT